MGEDTNNPGSIVIKQKMNSIVGLSILLLVVALGIMSYLWWDTRQKKLIADNNLEALTDTVRYQRNNLGELTATTKALTGTNTKLIKTINSKDAILIRLQGVVDKYEKTLYSQGSATVFNTQTSVASSGETVVTPGDTVRIPVPGRDSVRMIYPVYSYDFKIQQNGKTWAQGSTRSDKDSSHVSLYTFNEYDAVVGFTKPKFFSFKSPIPEVYVTSRSPLDTITNVKAFIKSSQKPSRVSLSISAGAGPVMPFKTKEVGLGAAAILGFSFKIF